ncbi:MAG: MFS transporter, partial [Acutalibacteraceae bacterium]
RRFANGGTLMFSVLALCGDFGCSIGPWLMGIVANSTTLETGFLVCTVFPVIMIIAASLLHTKNS